MNKYIRREVTDSDMMSTIHSYDEDGFDLVTCTVLEARKFHVGEFSNYETPAKYLLIFKKAR